MVPEKPDLRKVWSSSQVPAESATRGFHTVLLTLRQLEPTAKVLTDIFGYRLLKQDGNYYRFVTDAVENAAIVDILVDPMGKICSISRRRSSY